MATQQPTERIPVRSFRAPDDLWTRFNTAIDQAPDPEAGISRVLRQFLRWYVGEPGAKLPERPARPVPEQILDEVLSVKAAPKEA